MVTYHDIDKPVDTGLRFPEPDDDGYSLCPGCGEVVRLEEGKMKNERRANEDLCDSIGSVGTNGNVDKTGYR